MFAVDFKRLLYRVQPVSQIKKRGKRKEEQRKRDAYYADARNNAGNRQSLTLRPYSTCEWSV